MKAKIVNKKTDSKIQNRIARKSKPQNVKTTNTRGGLRR